LDPLVLLTDHGIKLNQEYVAGWLSFFPAADLTPYGGIYAVPPSSVVRVQKGKHTVSKYWDFDPEKTIRYRQDKEYEEHFRHLFQESVRRRLCSETPVMAELSGGMDSSSIVCMADRILAGGTGETPRLDTVSYFDDSEPNWKERPYVNVVERKRGRIGCHIDIDPEENLEFILDAPRFAPTPAAGGGRSQAAQQFAACLRFHDNRVVLSGIGGDEVLGGVPSPLPELADLIAQRRFADLARQLKAWALNKRRPWFHLLFEAIQQFLPECVRAAPPYARPSQWLHRDLVERHRHALGGYQHRLRLPGPLPSFQENLGTLDGLRRQLACSVPPTDPVYERRYPFLDRNLLGLGSALIP
jgi:asparagine synthase (glutamine-hydrolysing)